ncbi:hypothetical protein M426DRAFT_326267 [Hypoxylon sp. CI-4A]|nr:hypothetical protein M426DRAFT_326267 [Hypoxylon sp. CI-4A]
MTLKSLVCWPVGNWLERLSLEQVYDDLRQALAGLPVPNSGTCGIVRSFINEKLGSNHNVSNLTIIPIPERRRVCTSETRKLEIGLPTCT